MRIVIAVVGLLLVSFFCGCINYSEGNEAAALVESNNVLKLLFFEKNFDEANNRLDNILKSDPNVKEVNKKFVYDTESKYGALIELKPEGYIPVSSKFGDGVEIYYNGTHEKKLIYYKISLLGSGETYRVAGLRISENPFPQNKLGLEGMGIKR